MRVFVGFALAVGIVTVGQIGRGGAPSLPNFDTSPAPSASATRPVAVKTPEPSEAPSESPTQTTAPVPTQRPFVCGCRIRGRVTQANGLPLQNAIVNVYRASDGSYVAAGPSDQNGYYSVLVPNGLYKILFSSPIGGLTSQFWNQKISLPAADVVAVSGRDIFNINAVLRP